MAKLRKLLSVILAVVMVTSLCGISALADGECTCTTKCVDGSVNSECPVCGADGADLTLCKGTDADDDDDDTVPTYVAQIEDTKYETLDEAVTAAADGATIVLLADCAATKTFYKSLTFTSEGETPYTLSMDTYGWRYTGDLVFDRANLSINTDSSSSVANNGEAAQWFTMVLNGSLTAKNGASVTFTFDSACGTNCAIYTGGKGVTINVETGSKFSIYGKNTKGVSGQGIQLDSTANTGIFVTGNSEFLIDGTNRGYVNSPEIYVSNSTFTVQNCTSNASNGGIFVADNSIISFLNNAGHGLSATTLDIKNGSVVTCNHNAYYGVTVGSKMTMDGTSQLTSNENGWGYTGGALRLASSSTTGTFAEGAKVELKFNVRNALENYGTCKFEDGVELEITYNSAPDNGAGIFNGTNGKLTLPENAVVMNNTAALTGGGICNVGSATIPASVKLYNNHAGTAGDDIYLRTENSAITFGKTGSGWILDDCNHAITGWFYDGYEPQGEDGEALTTRWNVITAMGNSCEDDREDAYYVEYTVPAESVTGVLALKAAHGYVDDTPYVPTPSNYTLTVKYVDEDGNEIAASDVSILTAGISYSTSAKEIEGYTFKEWDSTSDAVSGYMTGSKTVVYIYTASETEIPDEETPLDPSAPVDHDETDIPDENPPLDDSPKTGDERLPLAALWSLFVLSAIGLFTLAVTGRKTGKHETDR